LYICILISNTMKELTKAEEQIMQILWSLNKGFVNDIMAQLPEPKPAYNTVSTIVRILEQKGFVEHNAYGRTHEYFPVVAKKDYTQAYFKHFMTNYFGSYKSLASFFTREENLSLEELEDIRKLVETEISKKSTSHE
jgi:BlaI family penicillinase repressor